jgi:hypothetical protein
MQLEAGRPRNRGSIPDRDTRRPETEAHPVSYQMDTGEPLPGVKRPRREANR